MEFATPRRTARVLVRKNQSDLLILWQMFVRRFYELGTPYALGTRIETLDTIVDLGGNTGLAASYLTARYRLRTLLFVEPVPESAAMLRRNAALSPMDWIVEEVAAMGAAGTLEFTVSGYWAACTGVPEVAAFRRARPYHLENRLARPSIRVPTVPMEQLLHRHSLTHIDLLKVDIEGGDADIFERPQPSMECVERIVLEIHDRYIDGQMVRHRAPWQLGVATPLEYQEALLLQSRDPAPAPSNSRLAPYDYLAHRFGIAVGRLLESCRVNVE
ncbi:FkbM family methyltransferase [Streptomyces sp. NPDC001709]